MPHASRPWRDELPTGADVVIIGAGLVGATTAARLASAGRDVCLLDRGAPGSGTSSAGEGNLLVSDKLPGPELDLARRSLQLWRELSEDRASVVELEKKGGLVVAHSSDELGALSALATRQRSAGIEVSELGPDDLRKLEPRLADGLAGGAFYPGDCQIQPMRAVAARVGDLLAAGGSLVTGAEVTGCTRRPAGVALVHTTRGSVAVGTCVVNAAGPWSGASAPEQACRRMQVLRQLARSDIPAPTIA
jgi:glycine/D-amino acid oxidase-like deaminating enzyme